MDDAKSIIAQAERLKQERSQHDRVNNRIRDLMFPATNAFDRPEVKGRHGRQEVYDNTAENAGKNAAAALHGLLTSPSVPWFALVAREPRFRKTQAVREHLEIRQRLLATVFNSPIHGFTVNQNLKYLDLVFFGGGAMFIDERPGFGPKFITRPTQEIYLVEDGDGNVIEVWRIYRMTAMQAVRWFRRFRASPGERVEKAASKPDKAHEEFEFVHVTRPNAEHDAGRLDVRAMRYKSLHVGVADKHLIRASGYQEMPWVVPRWSKRPGEVYPRGMGTEALSDTAMLQRMMKATIRGSEKTIDPPLLVPDDGIMRPVKTTPSGLNFIRADLMAGPRDPIRAIQSGSRPEIGEAIMERVRERIERAFVAHLLRITQDPRMTATQVLEIAERTDTVLGPNLARLEAEDLEPVIMRTDAVLERAGVYGPVPEELESGIEIDFLSPMQRAQRLTELRGYVQGLEFVNSVRAALGSEDAVDVIDGDAVTREALDILGWPVRTVRSPAKVADIRRARTEALQAANDLDDAGQVADIAGRAAPLLEGFVGSGGDARAAQAGAETDVRAA